MATRDGMHWSERIEKMDRRIVFAIMAVAVLVPLIFPLNLPIEPTKPVQKFYDAIEALPEGSIVLFSGDWDPGSKAELQTAQVAALKHLFRRGIRPIVIATWPTGARVVSEVAEQIARDMGKKHGVDWVNLGFKEGREVMMVSVATSIHNTYPVDYYGNSLGQLPMMKGIDKISDVAMFVNISAGYPGTKEWVQQVQKRFNVKMIVAASGVSTPEYYPYYDSGQISGMIGGLKGVAEYEKLTGDAGFATKGMDAQSLGHFVLVALILFGNVLYFMRRKMRRQGGTA